MHLDQSGDRFSETGLILFVVRQVARIVVTHFVTQEAQQFDHDGLLCTKMIGRSQLLLVRSHHLVEACAVVCERRERLIKILTNADELFSQSSQPAALGRCGNTQVAGQPQKRGCVLQRQHRLGEPFQLSL